MAFCWRAALFAEMVNGMCDFSLRGAGILYFFGGVTGSGNAAAGVTPEKNHSPVIVPGTTCVSTVVYQVHGNSLLVPCLRVALTMR